MPYARLTERSLLAVTGEDAEPFLQTLVTSDLDVLASEEMRPSALLTPQGKILFDFLIGRIDGGFRLDVAAVARDALIKRLTLYRLRAKVALAPLDDAVFAVWDAPARSAPSAEFLVDRRFPGDSVARAYGSPPEGLEEADAKAFEALRLRAGIAEAETDFPASDAFPHDVLLDQNGGVSFKKGCFVGQEVVSRMQHRGTARRRIMLLVADGHLTPGATILSGGRQIGTVLSGFDAADGGEGIGMIRIDRLAGSLASGEAITADGVALEATIPPWAGFALPVAMAETGEDA